jgi:phosphoribosylaminoimidazole carboxylase (NCAIR synthetase)
VPRPGRKMGHLTVLGNDVDDVAARAVALRQRLSWKPIESGSPPPATME